jgi:DNA-binding GntR family transcriptional regulator
VIVQLSNFKPQPVARERTSDSVLQVLRDSILSGVFVPGQRLNTSELAQKLDVSIAPVRDALNRLQSEGLIDIRPRSGTFVSEIAPREVRETFEVRAALECLAVELAIGNLSSDHINRLQELVKQMEVPVTDEGGKALHEQRNQEFHSLIVELSGNGKLIEMYRQLKAHIAIARIHYQRGVGQRRMQKVHSEHRRILSAFKTRDGERAKELLRSHILAAASRLTEDLVTAKDK